MISDTLCLIDKYMEYFTHLIVDLYIIQYCKIQCVTLGKNSINVCSYTQ